MIDERESYYNRLKENMEYDLKMKFKAIENEKKRRSKTADCSDLDVKIYHVLIGLTITVMAAKWFGVI